MARRRRVLLPAEAPTAAEVPATAVRPGRGKKILSSTTPVNIAGETFQMRVQKRRIVLTHERWSLMGAGSSLGEAEIALRREAALVIEVFGPMAPATLDDDATAQLWFALRAAVA